MYYNVLPNKLTLAHIHNLILSRQRPNAGVGNQHDGGGIVRRLDAPKRDSCCHRVDVLDDCQPWSAYADHKSQRFVALSTSDTHVNNTCVSHGSWCERVSIDCKYVYIY